LDSDNRDLTDDVIKQKPFSSVNSKCVSETGAVAIYSHLRQVEDEYARVDPALISTQREITSKMRTTLVDWLVEVSEEFSLVPETLFLAVAFVDRYLVEEEVPRRSLQLLGITCIFIAAKFEEIYAPQISELCDITDNTYCSEQILVMERQVLRVLRFRVCQPTVNTFLNYYILIGKLHQDDVFLSNYLCELTLLDCTFLEHRVSVIAAAATMLSTSMVSGNTWSGRLESDIGYEESDLMECALAIKLFVTTIMIPSECSVYEKYSQLQFNSVAKSLHTCVWQWPI